MLPSEVEQQSQLQGEQTEGSTVNADEKCLLQEFKAWRVAKLKLQNKECTECEAARRPARGAETTADVAIIGHSTMYTDIDVGAARVLIIRGQLCEPEPEPFKAHPEPTPPPEPRFHRVWGQQVVPPELIPCIFVVRRVFLDLTEWVRIVIEVSDLDTKIRTIELMHRSALSEIVQAEEDIRPAALIGPQNYDSTFAEGWRQYGKDYCLFPKYLSAKARLDAKKAEPWYKELTRLKSESVVLLTSIDDLPTPKNRALWDQMVAEARALVEWGLLAKVQAASEHAYQEELKQHQMALDDFPSKLNAHREEMRQRQLEHEAKMRLIHRQRCAIPQLLSTALKLGFTIEHQHCFSEQRAAWTLVRAATSEALTVEQLDQLRRAMYDVHDSDAGVVRCA